MEGLRLWMPVDIRPSGYQNTARAVLQNQLVSRDGQLTSTVRSPSTASEGATRIRLFLASKSMLWALGYSSGPGWIRRGVPKVGGVPDVTDIAISSVLAG